MNKDTIADGKTAAKEQADTALCNWLKERIGAKVTDAHYDAGRDGLRIEFDGIYVLYVPVGEFECRIRIPN